MNVPNWDITADHIEVTYDDPNEYIDYNNFIGYYYAEGGNQMELLDSELWWKVLKASSNPTDNYTLWNWLNCPSTTMNTKGVWEIGKGALKAVGATERFINRLGRLSYKEAFSIPYTQLRIKVFSSINVGDMIENLGYEKIMVNGMPVKRRVYNEDGSYKVVDNDVIYELLKVKTSDLLEGAREETYGHVVKVWCTSTNQEHFLWVMDNVVLDKKGTYYEDAALRGISSTCVLEDNLLPHIKQIKRQGDLFLIEWEEDFDTKLYNGEIDLKEYRSKGKRVQLNPEQYFGLLVSES